MPVDRNVHVLHYSGQYYYYYVDGSLYCSKRVSPKGLSHLFSTTSRPFFARVCPSLSPFPLYLPRFKGVVLKRKRRVVLRISLQFLLAPPPLFNSLSLSLSLSLCQIPRRVPRNSIQERMFIKFYTRAPRRHKSRVPMSNIFQTASSTLVVQRPGICIFRSLLVLQRMISLFSP